MTTMARLNARGAGLRAARGGAPPVARVDLIALRTLLACELVGPAGRLRAAMVLERNGVRVIDAHDRVTELRPDSDGLYDVGFLTADSPLAEVAAPC